MTFFFFAFHLSLNLIFTSESPKTSNSAKNGQKVVKIAEKWPKKLQNSWKSAQIPQKWANPHINSHMHGLKMEFRTCAEKSARLATLVWTSNSILLAPIQWPIGTTGRRDATLLQIEKRRAECECVCVCVCVCVCGLRRRTTTTTTPDYDATYVVHTSKCEEWRSEENKRIEKETEGRRIETTRTRTNSRTNSTRRSGLASDGERKPRRVTRVSTGSKGSNDDKFTSTF